MVHCNVPNPFVSDWGKCGQYSLRNISKVTIGLAHGLYQPASPPVRSFPFDGLSAKSVSLLAWNVSASSSLQSYSQQSWSMSIWPRKTRERTLSKVMKRGKCRSSSWLNRSGRSFLQRVSSSRSMRTPSSFCDCFSFTSLAISRGVNDAVARESSSFKKYSSTLPASTLDWVTKSWRGFGISSPLCITHDLSIPSILNSMVVVFLRNYNIYQDTFQLFKRSWLTRSHYVPEHNRMNCVRRFLFLELYLTVSIITR